MLISDPMLVFDLALLFQVGFSLHTMRYSMFTSQVKSNIFPIFLLYFPFFSNNEGRDSAWYQFQQKDILIPLKALYTLSNELNSFLFPFTVSKTFTSSFLWWFILMHLLRSRTIFIISLYSINVWILIQSFLHAFVDACTASVDPQLQHILLIGGPGVKNDFF